MHYGLLFNYQKNHEYLLSIFRAILRIHPESVLLLVGAGENQKHVEILAKEYGIADCVIFYGVTNDIPAVMMAMDVFVFPSRFEGFGNVLIEAQACGLKCFASNSVIPKAVQITKNVTWIDLDEPYQVWAEKILSIAKRENQTNIQNMCNLLFFLIYNFKIFTTKIKEIKAQTSSKIKTPKKLFGDTM